MRHHRGIGHLFNPTRYGIVELGYKAYLEELQDRSARSTCTITI